MKPTDHKAKLQAARRKFGRPFAHELRSTWVPPRVPVLTRWLGGQP